jgi:hypothetical protein
LQILGGKNGKIKDVTGPAQDRVFPERSEKDFYKSP